MFINKTLENTKGAVKHGQSRKTGKYGAQDKDKQNTICVGHNYMQPDTNNIIKT